MAEISSFDLERIKKDVILSERQCAKRGLLQSAKWCAEIAFSLKDVPLTSVEGLSEQEEYDAEYERYTLAKCYFDLKEYDRAAFFTESSKEAKGVFLHLYSKYLSGEKKGLDDAADITGQDNNNKDEHLKSLKLELQKKYKANELDGYSMYLYGVVLKKLDLLEEAIEVFVESIHLEPLHWGSWDELALLVTGKDMLQNLSLPDHWIKQFFLGHAYLELQLNEEALKLYQGLAECGFHNSSYVMAQIAMAHQFLRVVDLAVETFSRLQKIDPFRLDNMDIYSNLLYIKEMRAELAYLAHRCCDIDKYRVETCIVIGNYYSLRMQHEKAVLYFQRALKLNPNYLSAWTLMGHEYVEIKNTSAAIQAYRKAIEVNRRDYRACYGLGQIYEILKMPFYSLYYYRQAQMLRPNDSRMVVALGETYEKLDRLQEAKKCFWRAHSMGDVEGMALIRLAKLFERLNEDDHAAGAYTEYIIETQNTGNENFDELCLAYKYLANFHVKHRNLDEAYLAAQKCTEFNETREEGKALLQQISNLRAQEKGDIGQQMDLSPGNIGSGDMSLSTP